MKKITKIISGVMIAAVVFSGASVFVLANDSDDSNGTFKCHVISEEQKEQMKEKCLAKLKEMLDNGKITEDEYNEMAEKIQNGEMTRGFGFGREFGRKMGKKPQLTEEQKAKMEEKKEEMKEKHLAKLKEMLDGGKITEDEYNKMAEKIQNDEMTRGFGFGRGFGRKMGKKPQITEEQKAKMEEKKEEMKEKHLAKLKEMLDSGKITEDEYNKMTEKGNKNGEKMKGFGFKREGRMGKGPKMHKDKGAEKEV